MDSVRVQLRKQTEYFKQKWIQFRGLRAYRTVVRSGGVEVRWVPLHYLKVIL